MAGIIPAEILDAACVEIADISIDETQAEVIRLCRVQPALFSYFMTMTGDLGDDERAFASHVFLAIYKVFERQFGGRLENVEMERVEQIADRNEQAMIYLRIRHPEEEELLSAAMPWSVSQPSLLAYVAKLILRPPEGVPQLSGFQQDGLLIILKTVIDVLDSAVLKFLVSRFACCQPAVQ